MDQEDETKTDKPLGNRDRAILKDELLSELVAGCQNEGDLLGPDAVFTRLDGAVMEKLLEAEMTAHLGHEPHERRKAGSSRNGHSVKTVRPRRGPCRSGFRATATARLSLSWSRSARAASKASTRRFWRFTHAA